MSKLVIKVPAPAIIISGGAMIDNSVGRAPVAPNALNIFMIKYRAKQRRNYSFGIKFSIGILTCFALYFITNMFNALGSTGTLPPLLAIIAPPLIIIAGAGIFITSFDTI